MAAFLLALALAAPASAREKAPGAPGRKADWASPAKHGFGTANAAVSNVWFTLGRGGLGEIFYPDLEHPSARDLQFMVDGRTVTGGAVSGDKLTYTQVTEKPSHWRLSRIYVTDPERATVLVRVHLESIDNTEHDLELAYDPALYGTGNDDVGWTHGHALLSHDRHIASALMARPSLTRTSSGYAGHDDALLEHSYDALRPGNVVQQAHTRLTGMQDHRDLTLAISFADVASEAMDAASASLDTGFDAAQSVYALGWLNYRNTLFPIPAPAVPFSGAYESSVLLLKAAEDKAHPGLFASSPTAGHVARVRDTYEIATALIADGDKAAAKRALNWLYAHHGGGLALVLASQLGAGSAHVRETADEITQPAKQPAELAAQIAGLVCAAALDRKHGAPWLRRADAWRKLARHKVVDARFPELVRLGVLPAGDPVVVRTMQAIDQQLELAGRPTLIGLRGEYELLAGRAATGRLSALAGAANDGEMLPERTGGIAPLLWAHAQLIRLVWDIATGAVPDRPKVVADRYASGG
jgi:glucoamylase